MAFTFANAIAYVQAALAAGLQVDDFAPQLSFFFNAHNNLLEEVAKFRAARRLWARIMRERFGAQDPKSWMLRFHTQTAGSMLTAQQPDNNVVRVALQALAAVLGGTQSLHTNSRDEALSLPTEQAVQIALRTQQIIAHESGVADTIDPLAGSYLIESWTDEIEKRAVDYIERIDALGGALRAIEQGYIQREIQESAYRWQLAVDRRRKVVVGVNRFRSRRSWSWIFCASIRWSVSGRRPGCAPCGGDVTTQWRQQRFPGLSKVLVVTTTCCRSSWMRWKSTPRWARFAV